MDFNLGHNNSIDICVREDLLKILEPYVSNGYRQVFLYNLFGCLYNVSIQNTMIDDLVDSKGLLQ